MRSRTRRGLTSSATARRPDRACRPHQRYGIDCARCSANPPLDHHLVHAPEAPAQQRVALSGHRHVQLVVGQPALAEEVVADEIAAAGCEQRPGLRMQRGRMVLVAQLVHRLVGDDEVERPQARHPRRLAEAALDERDPRRALAQSFGRELVHRRGEVERHVSQVGIRAQQMLGEEPRPRAQLEHPLRAGADLAREGVEDLGAHRPPRQGRLGPGSGVGHLAQVDRARDVVGHGRAGSWRSVPVCRSRREEAFASAASSLTPAATARPSARATPAAPCRRAGPGRRG